jgi:hypothetical protein
MQRASNPRRAIVVAVMLVVGVPGLAPGPAWGQGTVETQKGRPPDPNAASPEYAPAPGAPPRAPAIEPLPGTPAPGAATGAGPSARVTSRRVLGLPRAVLLLGIAALGLVLLGLALRGRSRPG